VREYHRDDPTKDEDDPQRRDPTEKLRLIPVNAAPRQIPARALDDNIFLK
jgi:hypothetical protein